ncbi:MAG: hypothetical protein J07AB43_14310 [Candidatus Nanosalina sp. J07AB43]|nr:MAG: hypothetical protein J07AB43_14310 [Candidatus Nanosalina sp. J07AB43]
MSDIIDHIEEEDSLLDVYEILDDDKSYRMNPQNKTLVQEPVIHNELVKMRAAHREIKNIYQDNFHQEQKPEDSKFQGLARQTASYEGADIETYGLAHGYDSVSIGPNPFSVEVPLFHGMSEDVEELVQSKVDELLEDEYHILYEEGFREHFGSEQLRDPRLECMYDHSVLAISEHDIGSYSMKEIAKIPFYKAVSNLPYEFAGSLGNRQTVEHARKNVGGQEGLHKVIDSRMPAWLQQEYTDIFDPVEHLIRFERSDWMASQMKRISDSDGTNKVAAFVGDGHVNQAADILNYPEKFQEGYSAEC